MSEAKMNAMEELTWTARTEDPTGEFSMPDCKINGISNLIEFLVQGCKTSGFAVTGVKFSDLGDDTDTQVGVMSLNPMIPFTMEPIPGSPHDGSPIRVHVTPDFLN